MIPFGHTIKVGDLKQEYFEPLETLVDTGAIYTWISSTVLERLGYTPQSRQLFRLENGDIVEHDICEIWICINSDTRHTLCVFGPPESVPRIGSYTLDGFGLGIDYSNRKLIPKPFNVVDTTAVDPEDKLLVLKGKVALDASRILSRLSTNVRNRALINMAQALETHQEEVLEANELDYISGQSSGLTEALLDRLLLTSERVRGMVRDVRSVVSQPDPLGEVFDMRTLPSGLLAGKKRVPLGIIGAIYESRPNVTVDIAALCIKSGNACILRGGSEAIHSNTVLARIIGCAIADAGVPREAVQFVEDTDRSLVKNMLTMKEYIDLLIPRGGANFIRFVTENATMPTITGGIGVCHTYVEGEADIDKAVEIAYNAKVQRPTVCNALDSLLVDESIAPKALPTIAARWAEAGVEIRCDPRALSILGSTEHLNVKPATQEDWGKEFLSLVVAVKVVSSIDEALEHIERYGSGHSEAIVTENYTSAMRFQNEVDAAVVYVNASTRFTDGAQFGLGAEVGISTQKVHARGPMGLKELTSYKWIVFGEGQVVS